MNKSESKYFNTAIKMDEAFISLLQKKDFDYITIKEICSCAGVNRSTFYLHYETTRDLLTEAFDAFTSFRNMFRHLFNPILERFSFPEEERGYILSFYIRGIIGIVTEWLNRDCAEPVEFITGLIMKCILPAGNGGAWNERINSADFE